VSSVVPIPFLHGELPDPMFFIFEIKANTSYYSNNGTRVNTSFSRLSQRRPSTHGHRFVGSSLFMDAQQREVPQTSQAMEDVQGASDSSIGDKTCKEDGTTAEGPTYTVHLEVRLKTHSTARADLIKQLVHKHVSADQQLYVPGEISGWQSEPRLAQNVHRIMACETCKLPSRPVLRIIGTHA
jgi:hypothetical protein